jgi:hypothetical protein
MKALRNHSPDASINAGIGNELVVSAVITPRPGKAVDKDAALQTLARCLAVITLWRVVVALAAELACSGKFMASRKMPWFGLVWFGLVWFGLVWFGLVWFGLVWFGRAAYDRGGAVCGVWVWIWVWWLIR